MKGTLLKEGKSWIVEHWINLSVSEYPIHPHFEKYYFLDDDDNVKEVEFEIEDFWETGMEEVVKVAKLIRYKQEESLQFLATQAQELGMGYETEERNVKLEKISKEQLEKERNPAYKYFDIDEKPAKQKIKKLTEEEWVELNNAKPEKEQTAVEWLIEEMHKNANFIPVHVQEKAREIEKIQIIDACKYGNNMYRNFESIEVTGRDYYDKKFGKNKKN